MSRTPLIVLVAVCVPLLGVALVGLWRGGLGTQAPAPVLQFVTTIGDAPNAPVVTTRSLRQSVEPFVAEHFARLTVHQVTGIAPPSGEARPAPDQEASISSSWISADDLVWRLVTLRAGDHDALAAHASALESLQVKYPPVPPRMPEPETREER